MFMTIKPCTHAKLNLKKNRTDHLYKNGFGVK